LINNQVREYEENLRNTFSEKDLNIDKEKLNDPTNSNAKEIKKKHRKRLEEWLRTAPLKSEHIKMLVRETVQEQPDK